MPSLACNFCDHVNPEGSKFCNECGSPLNLTLCSRCEAINPVLADRCHQCGAPLSSRAPEQMAIPPAVTEIAQGAGRAPTADDAIPISVAERLDAVLGDPRVMPYGPQSTVEEPAFQAASPAADLASPVDDGPSRPLQVASAAEAGRNANRTRGFFVAAFFAVVAGALYWMFMEPTYPPDRGPETSEARSSPPDAGSSAPAAPVKTDDISNQVPTGDRSLPDGPLPTVRESTPPGADADQPAASQVPANADAQVPSRAKTGEPVAGRPAKTSDASRSVAPRRVVNKGRTKEQAERDAIATQRLIARELADSPPASSDNRKPPPGQ